MTPYAKLLLERKAAAPALPKKVDVSAAGRTACSIPAALAGFGPWMRIKDVAEFLGVSVTHVTALRESLALEGINIACGQPDGVGADWRISRASLIAFEAQRHNQPAP